MSGADEFMSLKSVAVVASHSYEKFRKKVAYRLFIFVLTTCTCDAVAFADRVPLGHVHASGCLSNR